MRKIAWSEQARANIRRLDRDTAMRIFVALQRFAETGQGDVKKLKGESGEILHIHSVRHRKEAYR